MGRFRPLTVLAGPNGCGKTSVLYAVVQALRGAMRARIPDVPLPSDSDLHRSEPSGRRPVVATVDLELGYEQAELDAVDKVFKATAALRHNAGKAPLKGPQLPDGHLKVHWQYPRRVLRDGTEASLFDLRSTPDHGAVWLSGFSAAWGAWKAKILHDVTDMYPIGGLRVFPQDRDRRWGIDVDEAEDEAESVDRDTGSIGQRVGRGEEPTVKDALRTLGGFTYGKGLEEQDDRRQWEARLQARFEGICGPKKYLGYFLDHPRYGETPLFSDQGREYPFSRAASGEHVILHYLTKFTFPRPVQNSIILIDEPELHLHPRWMRALFQLFAQSTLSIEQGGDNNQFIMTTHSPELRRLAERENALIDLGDLGGGGANAG